MPNAVVARLLTAGLAAAALLAPLGVHAPASAVSEFASCAEIRAAQSTAPDGDYEITVFDRTVTVFCADMATTPREYLSLPRTGGAYNFSQDTYFVQVTTHYTRVRLNLPSTAGDSFSINPTDDRFATSDGAPQRWWGYTGSCFNQPNNANLDLTGTPFGMSTAHFVHSGWGSTTISSGTQIIDVFGGGDCGGVYAANPFPLTWLHTAPSVTADPADQTVASGADATFTASGTGTPTPTLSWQSSPDGTTWTDVPGATSGTLVVQDTTYALDGTLYRALVTNDQGTAPTAPAELTVTPLAPGVTDPADAHVASGDDATFGVTVTGDPAPTVRWETSTDGGLWTDVDGATGTDLVLTDVTTAQDGDLFRAVVTNAGGTATSGPATLSVDAAAPVLSTAPVDQSVDAGEDAVFTAVASGDPAPAYQWQTSVDGTVWTDVAGATTGTLTLADVTAAQDGLWIRVTVANEGGAATSEAVRLTVAAAPVAAPAPGAPPATPTGTTVLAVTGGGPLAMLALAGALLAAGVGTTVLARRRTTAV